MAEVTEGVKYDSGKLDWTLLPLLATENVVKVLDFGAKKYARDNWMVVPDARQRYMAAALRHIVAYQKGELNDPESGQSHLAHATCCLLFIDSFDESEKIKGEKL